MYLPVRLETRHVSRPLFTSCHHLSLPLLPPQVSIHSTSVAQKHNNNENNLG